MTQWRAVVGDAAYLVSDEGQVLSLNYNKTGEQRLLKQTPRRGYLSVMLRSKQHTVHSLIAAAFIGPRPEGLTVNHKDGRKTNNAAANLEYVTPSENSKHAYATGLGDNKGEAHSQHKLTDTAVREIRALLGTISQSKIAARYGVVQALVSRIKHRKAWSHVTESRVSL